MLVECVEFKKINSEYLKAVAKIRLIEWGMLISDIKLMAKGDKFWCAWPDRAYKDKNGETKYYKIIHFEDKEKGRQIMKDAEDALWKKYEEEHDTYRESVNKTSSIRREDQFSFDHL